ncbi:5973_t:CDS:2, partial [Rhizophagus irregularis]
FTKASNLIEQYSNTSYVEKNELDDDSKCQKPKIPKISKVTEVLTETDNAEKEKDDEYEDNSFDKSKLDCCNLIVCLMSRPFEKIREEGGLS